jgi:hypothetical protein
LLEKYTKRNLQLDGLYNSNSLCFVLSKTDQAFDYSQYAKQYPDLGGAVALDMKEKWTLNGQKSEREREQTSVDKSRAKNKKKMKELFMEIKSMTSRLKALSTPPGAPISITPTRKRSANDIDGGKLLRVFGLFENADQTNCTVSDINTASKAQIDLRSRIAQLEREYSDLKTKTEEEAEESLSLGRSIKSLERAYFYARSRYTAQCIKHRNEQSMAAIKNDYHATLEEMGRHPNSDLQVFPVSATVHLKYQNFPPESKVTYLGFPNREDTHISALRDWLNGTTFDDRERYAQAFLDDVDAFLASIQPWIMDKYGENKMPAEVRAQWEPQMERLVSDLGAVSFIHCDVMTQFSSDNSIGSA